MSEEIKEYNVMLNNEQVKVLVNELNEKDKEIERLKSLWETDKQSWNELMAEKETEIERLREENDKAIEKVKSSIKEIERLNKALLDIKEYIEEMQVWCVEFDTFGVDTKGLECIVNKALGSDKE